MPAREAQGMVACRVQALESSASSGLTQSTLVRTSYMYHLWYILRAECVQYWPSGPAVL